MNGTQYKAAIRKLGMSQQGAADFLDISLRTSQGYAINEYQVPEPIAKLLRLMIKLELKPDEIH